MFTASLSEQYLDGGFEGRKASTDEVVDESAARSKQVAAAALGGSRGPWRRACPRRGEGILLGGAVGRGLFSGQSRAVCVDGYRVQLSENLFLATRE
jgi:hypothetical protein